jgi:hypothetical protein
MEGFESGQDRGARETSERGTIGARLLSRSKIRDEYEYSIISGHEMEQFPAAPETSP